MLVSFQILELVVDVFCIYEMYYLFSYPLITILSSQPHEVDKVDNIEPI